MKTTTERDLQNQCELDYHVDPIMADIQLNALDLYLSFYDCTGDVDDAAASAMDSLDIDSIQQLAGELMLSIHDPKYTEDYVAQQIGAVTQQSIDAGFTLDKFLWMTSLIFKLKVKFSFQYRLVAS